MLQWETSCALVRVNERQFVFNGRASMPPSEDGEWWELIDESRGLPYYYQTKTGETVWEKPAGFVIPLGIIQVRIGILG